MDTNKHFVSCPKTYVILSVLLLARTFFRNQRQMRERGASRALYSLNVLFDLLIQTDKNLGYPWIFGEIVVTLHP
jgi:hypothetical protein